MYKIKGVAYGSWICSPCGEKYGTVMEGHCSTIHEDKCDWCGKVTWVTEPRDYLMDGRLPK